MTDPALLSFAVAALALGNVLALAIALVAFGRARQARNLLAASDPMLAILDDVPAGRTRIDRIRIDPAHELDTRVRERSSPWPRPPGPDRR